MTFTLYNRNLCSFQGFEENFNDGQRNDQDSTQVDVLHNYNWFDDIDVSERYNCDDNDADDVDDDDIVIVITFVSSRDMGELDEVASLAERGALMYRQVNRGDNCNRNALLTLY